MKICKPKIRKIFLLLLIAFFGNSCNSTNSTDKPNTYAHTLQINNSVINVEIADTDEKRKQGLSNRERMEENQGMIFLFDSEEKYGFWMKDMNFDLDIIWIKENTIVDITKDVPAPNSLTKSMQIYRPKEKIDTVLEVNAGYSTRKRISPGQKIKIIK